MGIFEQVAGWRKVMTNLMSGSLISFYRQQNAADEVPSSYHIRCVEAWNDRLAKQFPAFSFHPMLFLHALAVMCNSRDTNELEYPGTS